MLNSTIGQKRQYAELKTPKLPVLNNAYLKASISPVIGLAKINGIIFLGAELSGKITVVVYIVSCKLNMITKFKSLNLIVRHAKINPNPTPSIAINVINKGTIVIILMTLI